MSFKFSVKFQANYKVGEIKAITVACVSLPNLFSIHFWPRWLPLHPPGQCLMIKPCNLAIQTEENVLFRIHVWQNIFKNSSPTNLTFFFKNSSPTCENALGCCFGALKGFYICKGLWCIYWFLLAFICLFVAWVAWMM